MLILEDRKRLSVVVAATLLVLGLVVWMAGKQIKSPSDVAAEAGPPQASLVTVPVEQTVLSSQLVVRGIVNYSQPTPIEVSAAGEEGEVVVSGLPKTTGESVAEGEVAIEISGRPVIVLAGELPAFRTLAPGQTGPDVAQLETALSRLGHDPGTVDDRYDSSTGQAVERLYQKAGYQPGSQSSETGSDGSALEEIESARSQLSEAEAALAEASKGPAESVKIEADRAVRSAEAALAEVKVGAAQQVEQANTGLTQAKETEDDEEIALTEQELGEAEAEAGQQNQAAELATAEEDLRLQVALRDELLAQGAADAAVQQRSVEDAKRQLKQAEELAAEAALTEGTPLPAAEIRFVSSLPQKVQKISAELGDKPTDAVMVIASNETSVKASVAAADRLLIKPGAKATLEDSELGISVEVSVASIADKPQTKAAEEQKEEANSSNQRYEVILTSNEPLPLELLDRDVKITIPFESTDGKVLAVPLAALSMGADGTSRVEVERSVDLTETVEVEVGLNARSAGLVEVRPLVSGELEKGDRVVVNRNTSETTESAET